MVKLYVRKVRGGHRKNTYQFFFASERESKMNIEYRKLTDEINDLVNLYTTNKWEYHANHNPSKDDIESRYKSGWYEDDKETYWIEYNGEKVGLIILADISDTIPLFYDIRMSEQARGKGIGKTAITWATNYVFSQSEEKIRIEAYTRFDNYAMRKVFYNCGYVKEGYLRGAWEQDDGSVVDSLCYAIIRSDWEKGIRTPIKIDDVPF